MNQKIDVTPQEYTVIHDILCEHLPVGAAVWVFGSRAKNKTCRHSDIDIAIEYSAALPALAMHKLREAFTESHLPYTVDIVDMQNVDDNFKAIIERQKIIFPLKCDMF